MPGRLRGSTRSWRRRKSQRLQAQGLHRPDAHSLALPEELLALAEEMLGQVVDQEAHVGLAVLGPGRRACVGGDERRQDELMLWLL